MEGKTMYFERPGKENTETVLKLVKKYAEIRGTENIVVASTTGETGVKAARILRDCNVVVVTHHVGFRQPSMHELLEENRKEILENGARIFTTTHALSGVERAIRKKFETIMPLELVAHTLRLFGEGTKVCIEIAIMAVDAGLIPEGMEIIAIGGTGRGADTALVIKSASASRFFDLEVREVIAKPRVRTKEE